MRQARPRAAAAAAAATPCRQRVARAYRAAGAEAVEGYRKVLSGMGDEDGRAKLPRNRGSGT